jgi:hypothetical protein
VAERISVMEGSGATPEEVLEDLTEDGVKAGKSPAEARKMAQMIYQEVKKPNG